MLILTWRPAYDSEQGLGDDTELDTDTSFDDGQSMHHFWDEVFGDHFRIYDTFGQRTSRRVSMSHLVKYVDSKITWQANEPAGTEVKFEVQVNDGEWVEVKKGGKLPIEPGTPAYGMTFRTRQILRTTIDTVSPSMPTNGVHIEVHGRREGRVMDGHKVGLIRHREIELDESGKQSETWVVRGPTLQGIAAQRITVPPSGKAQDRLTAPVETIMKTWVQNNAADPVDTDRKVERLVIANDYERGETIERGTRYRQLHEELEKLSVYSGLGWNIYIDFENRQFVFDVFEGVDRTAGQSDNPRVIFSPEYDSLGRLHYVDSDIEHRNVVYIGGQDEGADREVVEVGAGEGINRIEMFVDARDEEETDNLISRAEEALSENAMQQMLEGGILTYSSFRYEQDYNLGDIVTVQHKGWGLSLDTPIVEITEIYEPSGFQLEAGFGKSIPTLIEKIKKELRQIDGEIKR